MFDLKQIHFSRRQEGKNVVVTGQIKLAVSFNYNPIELAKKQVLDQEQHAKIAIAMTFWRMFYSELVPPIKTTAEILDRVDENLSRLFLLEFSSVMSPNFEKADYQPIVDKKTSSNETK